MSPLIRLPDRTAALHTTPALQKHPKTQIPHWCHPSRSSQTPNTIPHSTRKPPQTNLPAPIHKPKATSQKRKKQKQFPASCEVSNPHRRRITPSFPLHEPSANRASQNFSRRMPQGLRNQCQKKPPTATHRGSQKKAAQLISDPVLLSNNRSLSYSRISCAVGRTSAPWYRIGSWRSLRTR